MGNCFQNDCILIILLGAVGVANDEMSPFCCSFTSLDDLRDEYICYLPSTFQYKDVQGSASANEDNDGEDGGNHDGDHDDGNSNTHRLVGERIKLLAAALSGRKDNEGDDIVDIDGASSTVNTEGIVAENTAVADDNTAKKSDQLMTSFRSLIASNFGDVQEHILCSSSCLVNREHTSGSISSARKAKSLVERWIARPVSGVIKDGTKLSDEDILIERDVIILVNFKLGVGAAATTVQCKFCVLETFEKYYNKWFVIKDPRKKFKKEKKPYKVMAQMLEVNAMSEYSDIALHGSGFNKDDICKNIEDSMIFCVVGKLQAVG